jgi:APA family basic amino acid/polyamine antiporter
MGLWSRKSIENIIADSNKGAHQLRRTLGVPDLIMLGVGMIIGAGLFSITGIAAAENAGPAIVISFIIAAIGCAFAGLCYSELSTMIPVAGSAYTYTYATMGELPAWVIGWTLVLEYAIGASAVAISWSAYISDWLDDLGLSLPYHWLASPWQAVRLPSGELKYGYINLPAVFILVAITLLLIRGIKQSAMINGLLVVIKVAVVIIFIGIGMSYINPENYVPFIPENTGVFGEYGWSGIFRAAGIVFFAYIGFDAVSTAAQEAKNPQRDMPYGIIGSLIVCTILYVLFSFVMVGLVNYKDLNVAAPVAVAIDKTPYWWLNWLIKLAILAGFSSVIIVLLLGQSRVFYSMARDGFLPKYFSDLHPKYQTPWKSNLLLCLFISLIAAFSSLELVGEMTSIGTLLAFVIVCLGVLILRYTHPEYKRPFRTPWVPLVPIAGILVCLSMMFSLSIDSWIRLVLWTLIGLVIYAYYGRSHARTHGQPD